MKKTKLAVRIISFGVLATGFIVIPTKANAGSVVDRVAISVPVSCTMTNTIVDGEEHYVNMRNNTYRDNIGTTTFTTLCNDGEGFSIYAVGYTNDEYGNTVLSSRNLGSTFDITTGTATEGATSNWAMKLSSDSTATYPVTIINDFASYMSVPSFYTKVATSESNTGMSTQGASFTTTYAAYINSSQPADVYSGQVKYTLVHPANEVPPRPQDTDPGYIAYYPNTNTYEGTMGVQTITSSDTSATLLASNFSRKGYGFAGWNTAYDYSGDFYGPNETINFEAGKYTDGNEGLSLYAVWVESSGFIQDWNNCSDLSLVSYNNSTGVISANLSSVTALTDLRDNQTYAVARLADGNCWIIENLRLSSDYTRSRSAATLSQGYGVSSVYGSFIGLADSESNNFSNTAAANSLYGPSDSATINIGTNDSPGFRLPRYNDTNTTNRTTLPDTSSSVYYGYGNYYNWPAAMASTKYYSSGYIDNDQESSKSNLANTSLCPSGWRLPYGSGVDGKAYDGDLASLDKKMGGSGFVNSTNVVSNISMSYYWRKFPNNIVYSGIMDGSSVNSRGNESYLWTTTAFDSEKAYGSSVGASYINPGIDPYRKSFGLSIRCLTE